jgi:mRNA export factor
MSFGAKQDTSLSKDVQLVNSPDDSISDLSWSSAGNYLAASSWDGKVRIYDVTQSVTGEGKAMITFDGPALSCSWSRVGDPLFTFLRFIGLLS